MQIKIFLPLLALLLLGSYFVSTSFGENSQKQSPRTKNSLVQTSGYKNLSSYVSYLQSRRSTPASPSERGAMSSALREKSSAANSSLRLLDFRRKKIIEARYKGYLEVSLRRIEGAKAEKNNEAKSQFRINIAEEKAVAATAKRAVDYNFKVQISKTNKRLLFLRANKKRNPAKRDSIDLAIEKTLLYRSDLYGQRGQKLQEIQGNFSSSIRAEQNSFVQERANISRWAFWASWRQKRKWLAKKETWNEGVRERYLKDVQIIANKKASGFGAISQMPQA